MSVKINLQLLLSGTVARPWITRATPCSRYSRRWLMLYCRKIKAPPSHPGGACTSVSYCQTVPGTWISLPSSSEAVCYGCAE